MDRLIGFVAELKRNSFPNAESFAKKLLDDELNGSREASVSVKTVKRDIGFLKNEMGAPLNYDPINKGYYLSEDWIFPFWELGNKELFASLISGKIGETALPPFMLKDLKSSMETHLAAWDTDGIYAGVLDSIILATWGSVTLNPEISRIVVDAWRRSRLISIEYKSPQSADSERHLLEVHALFSFENIWYAKAYSRDCESVRNFAIHRIRSAEIQNERFYKRQDIIRQVRSGFNVFGYDEVQNVRFRCAKEHAGFMSEREWFPNQKIERLPSGELDFIYPSVPRKWLVWLILYNEGFLELKEPADVRNEILEKAKLIVEKHGELKHRRRKT